MEIFKGREITDRALQLDPLDGLRGFAALLVILSHTSMVGWYFFPNANVYGVGKTGVYLFFVLSAFLLTYQLISKTQPVFNKDGMINFALRRTLRIYPLYILYLLAAVLTTVLIAKFIPAKAPDGLPFELGINDFFSLLFLQHAKGVEWSVVVEFKFYFLLPLLAFLFTNILKNKLLPCFILTALLIVTCQYFWPANSYVTNDSRLGIYAPVFLTGSFLAVIHHAFKQNKHLESYRSIVEFSGWLSLVIIVVLIPPVTEWLFNIDIKPGEFHKEFILYAVLWSLVLFSAIHGKNYIGAFFALPFLRYVGFISFSVYLTHTSIIKMVRVLGLGDVLSAWAVIFAVLIFSTLTYRVIERPCSKIRWPPKPVK